MKAIAGLGNPGKEYNNTRHNIGFVILDGFADDCGAVFKKQPRFESEVCEYFSCGSAEKILLIKPLTYMNNSGRAIIKILNYYNIEISDMIVVCDDINLEFGCMRIRKEGGHGGHNGLKSIINCAGGVNNFGRMRIGVSAPQGENLSDYVLSSFTAAEKKHLHIIIETGVSALKNILMAGIETTMNEYNKKHF